MMEHTKFMTKIISSTTEATLQLIIPFSLLSIILGKGKRILIEFLSSRNYVR